MADPQPASSNESSLAAPSQAAPGRWLLVVLLLVIAALYTTTLTTDHAWGGDFAQYIAQAASLSEGSFDTLIEQSTFRYDNSTDRRLGPKYYPWGYPLLLAPVYRLCGFDLVAMKLATQVFFLLALAATYGMFRRRLEPHAGLYLVALLGLSPYFFEHRQFLASDVPFLFFSLITIWAIQEVVPSRRGGWTGLAGAFLIGALIFVSCLVRASGIVFLPTLLVAQVVEFVRGGTPRPWRLTSAARALIPYATFVVLTLASNAALPHESSYADQLALITAESIGHNLVYYAMLPAIFFVVGSEWVGAGLYLITLPLVGIGVISRARQDYLYAVYAGLTLILYVLWPSSRQGLRFLFPLLPFYLYFMIVGAQRLTAGAVTGAPRRRLLRLAGAVLLALFVTGVLLEGVRYSTHSSPPPGPYQPDSIELFRFIRDRTSHDDTFAFFKPRVLTLYTGRKAADFTDWPHLDDCEIDWIIWNQDTEPPAELSGREMVFRNDSFVVYRGGPAE